MRPYAIESSLMNGMYPRSQGSSEPSASSSIKSEKERIVETLSANPNSRPYREHCFSIMTLFQRLVLIGGEDEARQIIEEGKTTWHPRKLFAASRGILEGLLENRLSRISVLAIQGNI